MPTSADLLQDRKHDQRPILPKKCLYCERRFSKAEHLKRHQRSHTGERPYRCSRCQKCFSRSDVLIRHLKNHPQIVGEEVEQSSSDGDHRQANGHRRPSTSSVVSAVTAVQMNDQSITVNSDVPPRSTSPSRIDPALLGPPGEYADQSSAHAMSSGLDHLALLASQQTWGDGTIDTAMTDAGSANLAPANESHGWRQDVSNHNQDFQGVITYQQTPAPSEPNFQMINGASNTTPGLDFGNDLYSGRLNALQDQISPGMGVLTPSGAMMPHELLNWFDQFDMDTNQPPDAMQSMGISPSGASHENRQSVALSSEADNSVKSQSEGSASTIIPTERFHKVERCWPTRPSNAVRLMPTLWLDAVAKPEDNLFSKANLTPEAIEHNRQYGSRWGLDEDCRSRLQRMFVTLSRRESKHSSDGSSPFSHSSPSDASSVGQSTINEDISKIPNFPPAEIFDISLDLYFRQFHPLMPFIHTPTFCPKTAPTSILLVMCLIGLTILQTKGAAAFVRQAFPKALEKVCSELTSPSREGRRIDQMSSLASAILILNLSEMTGEQSHQEQCQMLYTNVVMTAQRHGFFSTKDALPLDDQFFDQIPDLEDKWKAWGRIECAKRLIACLTMVDTWYSAIFHTSPVLRTDDLQLILPCDTILFQATSATKWQQLINRGSRMCMPTISMTSERLLLPEHNRTLDVHGMNTILCVTRLRISESFHRLLSGGQQRAEQQSFIPWKTYESDPRARVTQGFVVQIIQDYGPMLSAMNPNCMVLWHNMCIMLTTDLRLFELGAGCAGAEAARDALDDISVWARTPAARRSCLHAAQTFKLMSNRRASDGDPFHATSGLFIAALVLGLYVFMSAENPEGTPPSSGFDLSDDVDWIVVGNEGLTDEHQLIDDDAVNFIRNGGGICFNGVVHQSGYESSRRILLDYAQLLEDISKWRFGVHQFSRVLRIMSDALVDVEASGE
ncbi:Regulatory protein ADR1 [Lachnellula suecica]|uniref:Regulatory protein ADR1 n=1 Tax=Lachnellula suecica TaxID=602035 RepID=A0A8T9CBF3_9HELO|nr:Regulatory protein ADR1 [Lachnellula suecica]